MMGRRWKYWDGSIKGHLWNKTSVKLYLFQGIGVFLICVLLYPRSRFIGAIVFAAGFVAVDLIAQVIRVRGRAPQPRRQPAPPHHPVP